MVVAGAVAAAGSVVSGGLAYMGAQDQAGAAGEAGRMSYQAQMASIAEQRRQYDQSRTDLAPYRESGQTAMGEYGALYGVGRDGLISAEERDAARGRFQTSPGYQFASEEGQKAVARAGAASGRYNSGAGAKAMTRFSQGLANQEFGNYANRLANIAGMGQNAVNTGVQAGQNTANAISRANQFGAQQRGNALQAASSARASGYNAIGETVNNLGQNAITMYQNRSNPDGGGPTDWGWDNLDGDI